MFLVDMRVSFGMEHSEIIAWAIEGTTSPIRFRGSQRSANWPVEVGQRFASGARCPPKSNRLALAARNLRIVRTLLFGNRPFRRINCECPMCTVMVRLSSLEADHSPRPPLPLQRGASWRGSCELTGARVIRGSPVAQLAPWTTRFLATEVNR